MKNIYSCFSILFISPVNQIIESYGSIHRLILLNWVAIISMIFGKYDQYDIYFIEVLQMIRKIANLIFKFLWIQNLWFRNWYGILPYYRTNKQIGFFKSFYDFNFMNFNFVFQFNFKNYTSYCYMIWSVNTTIFD